MAIPRLFDIVLEAYFQAWWFGSLNPELGSRVLRYVQSFGVKFLDSHQTLRAVLTGHGKSQPWLALSEPGTSFSTNFCVSLKGSQISLCISQNPCRSGSNIRERNVGVPRRAFGLIFGHSRSSCISYPQITGL
jgi:hypothetical protein